MRRGGKGGATALPAVYATGGRSVVYAMGAAMETVAELDARLRAERHEPPAPRPDPFGGAEAFHLPVGYTKPIRS